MTVGYYAKLAGTNLIKNRRIYLPHILTGGGLIGVYHIINTLYRDERIAQIRGGYYLASIMQYGVIVLSLLSVILLLYANSFLMKQRRREFGLYHVLGMEKRHIDRILWYESLFSMIGAMALGMLVGILLYKACALLVCRILHVDSMLGLYYVNTKIILSTLLFFALVYGVLFLCNCLHIAKLKPIELLQSARMGEKEPKVKWVLFVLGLAALGGGYYLALTIKNPLLAISVFFGAVLLVVVGTYFLFVAGSIAILKWLKRHKNYYYTKRHMAAVSGMLYRMKRNAVGLGSITILMTGVILMISTTSSLYVGIEDSLAKQYRHYLTLKYAYGAPNDGTGEQQLQSLPPEVIESSLRQATKECGLNISYVESQRYLSCAYLWYQDRLTGDQSLMESADLSIMENIAECIMITAEEYEELTGTTISLKKNQVALFASEGSKVPKNGVFQLDDKTFDVVMELSDYPVSTQSMQEMTVVSHNYGIVVSDEEVFQEIYEKQKASYGRYASEIETQTLVDFDDEQRADANHARLKERVRELLETYVQSETDGREIGETYFFWDSREGKADDLYTTNGSLLFLGLLLSFVFLFATALIIYYKQISEGYEDRERFQIMEKVGMTKREVKQTIRSQVLLVFFSPLAMAILHCIMAFPILSQLLQFLYLSSKGLLAACMGISFGVFLMLYVIIYHVTAKQYYEIVHERSVYGVSYFDH